MEERFAVIDTETTWGDEVMSIGAVVACDEDFIPCGSRYYILLPYKNKGGMYSGALYLRGAKPDLECGREEAISGLTRFLAENGVRKIFAYNAAFDYKHLPELQRYEWFDIMKLAAYRQYNKSIPADAECCSTGRLKHNYGVESVYRLLSGDKGYRETHNALFDAADELMIMKMMNAGLAVSAAARL